MLRPAKGEKVYITGKQGAFEVVDIRAGIYYYIMEDGAEVLVMLKGIEGVQEELFNE